MSQLERFLKYLIDFEIQDIQKKIPKLGTKQHHSNQMQNPHGVGCPWHSITETWGAPNVKWCEETLCQWISEPANT